MRLLRCLIASLLLGTVAQSAPLMAREKPVLAVVDFRNDHRGGWWRGGSGGKTAEMLMNELASTRSFRLVDRLELESVLAEQNIRSTGRISPAQAAKVGKLVGAQYLVTGAVTDYEEGVKQEGGGISAFGITIGGNKTEAYVAVDLRVVDVETGEVAHVRSIEGRISGGRTAISYTGGGVQVSNQQEDNTPVGKAIRAALQEASGYFECVMVKQTSGCYNKYNVREEQRRASGEKALQRD